MKPILFIFLFIISSLQSFAQNIYVYDKSSLKPINEVLITSGSNSVKTDIFGQAVIDNFSKTEKIVITSSDYMTETLTFEELKLKGYTVYLSDKSYKTNEIIVSANKFDENSKYIPRQVEVINAEEITFANTQTTADLLQQTGTVFVQKSQLGGGSPVIRGFEANKVLVMIDGVRFNNLIFRGGHLQNVLRIDENVLSRTEVLFGSGSTIYGSDALGGVMSYYTKDPVLSMSNKTYTAGTAFFRYSSADKENTGHFSINLANKKVGFLGSITYSNFNALSMGTNNVKNQAWLRKFTAEHIQGRDTMIPTTNFYSQDPSGYNQYDILAKFLIGQSPTVNHIINFQYSNTNDIPRYDRLNTINPVTGNFTNAEWYYGPERRILGSYKLNLSDKNKFYDNSKILLAYQDVNESRSNRAFGAANLTTRTENVDVYSLNADFSKTIKTKNKQNFHNLSYGIEGIYNTLTSTAQRENINSGAVSPADTRYPDGDNNTTSFAIYAQDDWRINNSTSSTFGLRYNYYGLNASFADTAFYDFRNLYPDGIDQSNGAFAGNLGFTFLPKDDWRIYVNGSTGFRSPDIDDLSKIFETVPRTGLAWGDVIIPNPDLGPEYTYGGEIGVSKIFDGRVKAEAVAYYTYINDAIVTAPTTYNGNSYIIYDGDTANVTSNQNAGSGYVWGTTLSLNADVTNYLSLINTVTYTYGRSTTGDTTTPLDHIPPLFGKSGVVINLTKFKGEFNVLYNAWKLKDDYSLSGEDNLPDATPDGMPNWFTLNVKAAYQLNLDLSLQLEINNLLDLNYRTFASGINAPGINSVLSLRGTF